MNYFKKVIGLVSTTLIVASLVGCGTAISSDKANGSSDPAKDDVGIVNGELVLSVENPNDKKVGTKFTIQNNKTEDVTLTMNSSQYFDYQLKDEKGSVVYTYSADKMFTLMVEEKVLKPGDTLEMELALEENLINVPSGKYTLEVWSTASEAKDLKAKVDFHWVGSNQGKLNVQETVVTFVGLQDLNSIEVVNEQGQSETYRLAEVVKSEFDNLAKDTKIKIFYVDRDGQKEVQSVEIQ
ncbi:BsuPI-related putative proteinase inhibitor [Peribacillus alkalitolerans]|uniref:BsuPI-related putative proteinase inhibitor n=1 Tax=Peribacillus alkalitolerans TaxID=1550385 RepID=UPI0013D73269|nr:BsuPI-related putative proteinase inhibitor [Peribacillus alkalitolerans]